MKLDEITLVRSSRVVVAELVAAQILVREGCGHRDVALHLLVVERVVGLGKELLHVDEVVADRGHLSGPVKRPRVIVFL